MLRAHENDDAISELPYSAAAWKLKMQKGEWQNTWSERNRENVIEEEEGKRVDGINQRVEIEIEREYENEN